MPVKRHMQIYNSVTTYKCEHCGNEVEIIPLASTGVLVTIGTLVMIFWGVILFGGRSDTGMIGIALYALAGLGLLFTILSNLLPHWNSPIADSGEVPDIAPDCSENHFAKSPLIWLESRGFIAGLVVPLVVIGLVLAVATLIGYVSFTYF